MMESIQLAQMLADLSDLNAAVRRQPFPIFSNLALRPSGNTLSWSVLLMYHHSRNHTPPPPWLTPTRHLAQHQPQPSRASHQSNYRPDQACAITNERRRGARQRPPAPRSCHGPPRRPSSTSTAAGSLRRPTHAPTRRTTPSQERRGESPRLAGTRPSHWH